MKAILLRRTGDPSALEYVDVPTPQPGEGEVLVKADTIRKLERATYDSVAFRFIAANDHPDHDTIATFRRRFLSEIEGLFVKVLLLAREMGVRNLGTVALDGTKIHANASRHARFPMSMQGSWRRS